MALSGKRILVVEDEALVAMQIETILSGAGCVVLGPAAALVQALRLLADERPDAVLVDRNLVGFWSDRLALELRNRGIPFAFVSAYDEDIVPGHLKDVPYLQKPFQPEELLRVASNLVGR